MKDIIVERVKNKYSQRSEIGIKKYKTTLEENNLPLIKWLTHLQEEMMDATLYIEKLISIERKRLLSEMMEADEKDGLYEEE